MALEIERRFLVDYRNLPVFKGLDKDFITQHYLTEPHDSLVLRIREVSGLLHILTMKRKEEDGINKEFETPISEEAYHDFVSESKYSVQKTRCYHYTEDGHCLEVDMFEGPFKGIIIAEVELKSLDEPIVLPEFIGPEITKEHGVSNFFMACFPEATRAKLDLLGVANGINTGSATKFNGGSGI